MTHKDILLGVCGISSIVSTVAAIIAARNSGLAYQKANEAETRADLSEKLSEQTVKDVQMLCGRLDMTFEDVQRRTSIDISDALVNQVVADMTKRQVELIVPYKVEKATKEIKDDYTSEIKEEISKKVKDLSPDIRKKLEDGVAGVNINDLRETVVLKAAEEAKEECIGQIERETDRLIDDLKREKDRCQDKLGDVSDELNKAKREALRKIEDKVDDIIDELEDKADEKFDEELDELTTRYKARLDDVSDIYASLANKIRQ